MAIGQPLSPVFQSAHHENWSEMDAGDWVATSDESLSDRATSSQQETLCRFRREQPLRFARCFRPPFPVLAGPGSLRTGGFQAPLLRIHWNTASYESAERAMDGSLILFTINKAVLPTTWSTDLSGDVGSLNRCSQKMAGSSGRSRPAKPLARCGMALPELLSDRPQLANRLLRQCLGRMIKQNLLQFPIDALNQVLIGKHSRGRR